MKGTNFQNYVKIFKIFKNLIVSFMKINFKKEFLNFFVYKRKNGPFSAWLIAMTYYDYTETLIILIIVISSGW